MPTYLYSYLYINKYVAKFENCVRRGEEANCSIKRHYFPHDPTVARFGKHFDSTKITIYIV
jgi:hypothetical protein